MNHPFRLGLPIAAAALVITAASSSALATIEVSMCIIDGALHITTSGDASTMPSCEDASQHQTSGSSPCGYHESVHGGARLESTTACKRCEETMRRSLGYNSLFKKITRVDTWHWVKYQIPANSTFVWSDHFGIPCLSCFTLAGPAFYVCSWLSGA